MSVVFYDMSFKDSVDICVDFVSFWGLKIPVTFNSDDEDENDQQKIRIDRSDENYNKIIDLIYKNQSFYCITYIREGENPHRMIVIDDKMKSSEFYQKHPEVSSADRYKYLYGRFNIIKEPSTQWEDAYSTADLAKIEEYKIRICTFDGQKNELLNELADLEEDKRLVDAEFADVFNKYPEHFI